MMNLLLILLISGNLTVQTGWDLLATTTVKTARDPFLNEEIDVPEFPPALEAMNGQRISLDGYIIPLQQSTSQGYFVLSRFPYQSCFFCGGAGPETVVEVYSDRAVRFTDERVRVTGTLELNADDPLHLFFLLRDCEVIAL